jgi:hypothetical protein
LTEQEDQDGQSLSQLFLLSPCFFLVVVVLTAISSRSTPHTPPPGVLMGFRLVHGLLVDHISRDECALAYLSGAAEIAEGSSLSGGCEVKETSSWAGRSWARVASKAANSPYVSTARSRSSPSYNHLRPLLRLKWSRRYCAST